MQSVVRISHAGLVFSLRQSSLPYLCRGEHYARIGMSRLR